MLFIAFEKFKVYNQGRLNNVKRPRAQKKI